MNKATLVVGLLLSFFKGSMRKKLKLLEIWNVR